MSLLTKLKLLQELNIKLDVPSNNILRRTYYPRANEFISQLQNGQENPQVLFFISHYQSLILRYLEQHNDINNLRHLLDTNSEDAKDLRGNFSNRIDFYKEKISHNNLRSHINKRIEVINKAISNSKFQQLSCYEELKKILEEFKKYHHGGFSDVYFSVNFMDRFFEYVESETLQITYSPEELHDNSISTSSRSSHINYFSYYHKNDQENINETLAEIKAILGKIKHVNELSRIYNHNIHILEVYEQRGEEFNLRNRGNDAQYFTNMLNILEVQSAPYISQDISELTANTSRVTSLLSSLRSNIGALLDNTINGITHLSSSVLNYIFLRNEARIIPLNEQESNNQSEDAPKSRSTDNSISHADSLEQFSDRILDQEFAAPALRYLGGGSGFFDNI